MPLSPLKTERAAEKQVMYDTPQVIVSIYWYFKNPASFIAIVKKFWNVLSRGFLRYCIQIMQTFVSKELNKQTIDK